MVLIMISVLDLALLLSYKTDDIPVGSHLFFHLKNDKE